MSPAHARPLIIDQAWLPSLAAGGVDQPAAPREVIGEWYGCRVSSVFQPIVDPASGRPRGHEAFLRCFGKGGQRELSPWSLFSANASDERLIAFDRLVRMVHTLNFRTAFGSDQLLFLNVHGRLLAAVNKDHGAYFRRALEACGVAPEQVVIETPTAASHQTGLLAFVLGNYRNNGFRVAVNVDSAAQWQLISSRIKTDYVKIDSRSVLDADGTGSGGLDWLQSLKGNARLILTQLETRLAEDQLRPGTWAQGFAYGVPRPAATPRLAERTLLSA